MTNHRAALILFAVALAAALIAATITTLENGNTRVASNETPPGTMGLARPHPPLDRAPGVPIETPVRK
ncbi:hypothetical protein [Bradyrhizobium elkanii]|uniref:hypothetical protein n=1 Tax=Bradyrhizobium elkanii TaxID=29448 RepID=UPI0020A19FE4|nr:hypothetical protein [Bradyrhizobium elkanii]MCP1971783.1 hypothetical protein [Bradyrhizobium elkanii]MCS3518931.1 hypothetical protein [Bradyrhizobium elkanii]MCS4075489.1 hypothetical protein [Bradyrhizobium elkanii]MCS4082122.1 hypothetical protein [Bradyrhizobium elkanii]MCS4106711.1 hypothetical protein [Bradyrhizobium elkanii]